MKYIPCTIEVLRDRSEDCWMISVPCNHAADIALELGALHLGLADKVVFGDGTSRFTIRSGSVTLSQRTVHVEQTWLNAVWSLFLKAHRDGWYDAAHIDQDFSDHHGDLCISITLTFSGK